MAEYTSLSLSKETKKVLAYLKATGQSFDGFLRELIEYKTGKNFKTILEEAKEMQKDE